MPQDAYHRRTNSGGVHSSCSSDTASLHSGSNSGSMSSPSSPGFSVESTPEHGAALSDADDDMDLTFLDNFVESSDLAVEGATSARALAELPDDLDLELIADVFLDSGNSLKLCLS